MSKDCVAFRIIFFLQVDLNRASVITLQECAATAKMIALLVRGFVLKIIRDANWPQTTAAATSNHGLVRGW